MRKFAMPICVAITAPRIVALIATVVAVSTIVATILGQNTHASLANGFGWPDSMTAPTPGDAL